MIVKDEEEFLEACLESVKGLCDEIVIVDTGSRDSTTSIAKRYTDKVFSFVWCDDFSKARNRSLEHATGDWILVLDADEVIAEQDRDRIRQLIEDAECDGFFLDQRNYVDELGILGCKPNDRYAECRGRGFFTTKIVRLFRNHPKIRFRNRVHEIVDDSILDFGSIKDSGIPIHHYGNLRNPAFVDSKRQKYLELGLQQIAADPKDPRPHYEIARIYKNRGDVETALKHFLDAYALNSTYRHVCWNIADCYRKKKDLKQAELFYSKAEQNDPGNEHVFVNKGLLYIELGRPNESLACFQQALKINPESFAAFNNMIVLLIKCNRKEAAAAMAHQAFKKTGMEKFRLLAERLDSEVSA